METVIAYTGFAFSAGHVTGVLADVLGCTLFVQIAAFVTGVLAFVLEIYHGLLQREDDYESEFYYCVVMFTFAVHRVRGIRDNWLAFFYDIIITVGFSWVCVLYLTRIWHITSILLKILIALLLSSAVQYRLQNPFPPPAGVPVQ